VKVVTNCRVTLKRLRKDYKQALENEEYDYIDQVITPLFWGLKKVVSAFEKYIGPEEKPNRINPNLFDTPTYWYMKPSEQGNVEFMFMDEVLTGKRRI